MWSWVFGSREKFHVVFVGNPGSGKSTIANTVMQKRAFRSGTAVVEGLTESLQSHTVLGVKYSDTPGLDNIRKRKKAAGHISGGLKRGDILKLIFVITLEAGRVRPTDVATVKVTLDAIKRVGVPISNKFSVIINKCNDLEYRFLKDAELLNKVKGMITGEETCSHILLSQTDPEALNKDNALLKNGGMFADFVESAPVLQMVRKRANVNVNAGQHEEELERKTEELKKLQEEVDRLRKSKGYLPMSDKALVTGAGVVGVAAGCAAGYAVAYGAAEALAVVATGVTIGPAALCGGAIALAGVGLMAIRGSGENDSGKGD